MILQKFEFFLFSPRRSDMKSITLLLANTTLEHINSTVSARDLRTPLHLACAIGNLAIAQLLIWVISIFLFNNCLIECGSNEIFLFFLSSKMQI